MLFSLGRFLSLLPVILDAKIPGVKQIFFNFSTVFLDPKIRVSVKYSLLLLLAAEQIHGVCNVEMGLESMLNFVGDHGSSVEKACETRPPAVVQDGVPSA